MDFIVNKTSKPNNICLGFFSFLMAHSLAFKNKAKIEQTACIVTKSIVYGLVRAKCSILFVIPGLQDCYRHAACASQAVVKMTTFVLLMLTG